MRSISDVNEEKAKSFFERAGDSSPQEMFQRYSVIFCLEVVYDKFDVGNVLSFLRFVSMNEIQTFIEHFLREHDFSAKLFFDRGKGLHWTGEAFLVKKFRPQGNGLFFARNDFL